VLLAHAQDVGKLALGAAVRHTQVTKDRAKLLAMGGDGIPSAG
jgi:hypothetical protein